MSSTREVLRNLGMVRWSVISPCWHLRWENPTGSNLEPNAAKRAHHLYILDRSYTYPYRIGLAMPGQLHCIILTNRRGSSSLMCRLVLRPMRHAIPRLTQGFDRKSGTQTYCSVIPRRGFRFRVCPLFRNVQSGAPPVLQLSSLGLDISKVAMRVYRRLVSVPIFHSRYLSWTTTSYRSA